MRNREQIKMTDLEIAKKIKNELEEEYKEPVLRFRLEEGEAGILESKVGGVPYMPKGADWPNAPDGEPMVFLAQVNCAELEALPDFPQTGLLQFFIAADDVMGVDFDNITNNAGFLVLYHEQPDVSVSIDDVDVKSPPEEEYTPLGDKPCRINFLPAGMQSINGYDFRFEEGFLKKWNERHPDEPKQNIWEIWRVFSEEEQEELDIWGYKGQEEEEEAPHHQLGGFSYFTQTDPRSAGKYSGLDTLLFQLDSDYNGAHDRVLWGDCGVGNFFINREALRNRDFSNVGYSWDCC